MAILKGIKYNYGYLRTLLHGVRPYHLLLLPPQALLVHSGEEHSVDAAFLDNSLGNPLLLRK